MTLARTLDRHQQHDVVGKKHNALVLVVDGDIIPALKMLKKTLADTGAWHQIKRHEYHLSPSQRAREKSRRARARARKVERKRAWYDARAEAKGM